MPEQLNQIDRDILVRLLEYCKYLYEAEKERTSNLNNSVKVYIAFLTFILSVGAFKTLSIEKLVSLLKKASVDRTFAVFGIALFALSVLSLFISFVFTILILRIWRFERLSNPLVTAIRSVYMETENELLSALIANYIVASNRNHNINDQKAKLLSYALFSLIIGLALLVISLFVLGGISLWPGGGK